MNHSRERLHAEMTQTIEQLAGWLAALEGGLASILDQSPDDVIKEEQEPTSTLDRSLVDSSAQEMTSAWR